MSEAPEGRQTVGNMETSTCTGRFCKCIYSLLVLIIDSVIIIGFNRLFISRGFSLSTTSGQNPNKTLSFRVHLIH